MTVRAFQRVVTDGERPTFQNTVTFQGHLRYREVQGESKTHDYIQCYFFSEYVCPCPLKASHQNQISVFQCGINASNSPTVFEGAEG